MQARHLVSLSLLVGLAVAAGPRHLFPSVQEKEPTSQQVLIEDQLSFEHKDDPRFLFRIPKKSKKFQAVRERWRFANLEELESRALAEVNRALEAEEAKDPRDEDRLGDLRHRKRQIEQTYSRLRMRLEVIGDPEERIDVWVATLAKEAKLADVGPRSFAAQNWETVDYLVERETSSKKLKKAGGGSQHFEFKGVEKSSKKSYFYRLDLFLLPTKDRQQKYRVMYLQRMPSSRYSKDNLKTSHRIFSCFGLATG